jgi:hypothetical protein
MLTIHPESHVDHVTPEQLAYVLELFNGRDGFFIIEVEFPPTFGQVSCDLYGPTMGDPPVDESAVRYAARGDRAWTSRLVDLPARPCSRVTVVAGPHDGMSCVLFTVYGGPNAPQEPGDPRCADPEASKAFWSEHALAARKG